MEPFHLFIASCYEAKDIQIPRIIDNISAVNIPSNYVHIIVGGCPKYETEYKNGIEIISVTYRCFEFTPLIYIIKNPDIIMFEFAFFAHDTVTFGKNFYNTIQSDIHKMKMGNFKTMKIENREMSMNIGIYSKEIILKNKNPLLELELNTNDKDELMKMKHKLVNYEDFILSQGNMNTGDASHNIKCKLVGKEGTVSNGSIRHYQRIDLIKYQSNNSTIQSIDICIIPNLF
uniref:Uncharacterized protein n=1 Tax=viral metagenome TaxID=1070528 RepID=A0A6C0AQ87_9ZZZZ